MSKTIISVERVNAVEPHPNADRLDIIQVLGYKVITGRGEFSVGDAVIYFPPDILIPECVSEQFGVKKYLKHAVYRNVGKTQCRVAACRIRGLASYGFVQKLPPEQYVIRSLNVRSTPSFGIDVTDLFGGVKYEPPARSVGAGDAERDLPNFHKYTSIENYQRYPDAIPDGTDVVVTEKLHGTNVRMGYVKDENGEMVFVAGSHKVRRKEGVGLYWEFFDDNIRELLTNTSEDCGDADVILYGEIFGPGIQDMDYGLKRRDFRVFDISVDGKYMDYYLFFGFCRGYTLNAVPVLGEGRFSKELVEEYTDGPTSFLDFCEVKSKFKGREGIVIRPTVEQHSEVLNGRMILKSISADYLNRSGAEDAGE